MRPSIGGYLGESLVTSIAAGLRIRKLAGTGVQGSKDYQTNLLYSCWLRSVKYILQNGWIFFFIGWVVAALELEIALAIWGPAVTS